MCRQVIITIISISPYYFGDFMVNIILFLPRGDLADPE